MIKVNLLRDHTAHAHKAFAKPTVSRMGLILLVVFLLAAGTLWYWTSDVNQQIADRTERRAQLRKDNEELKRLNAEIDKYTKLISQLNERTRAIDEIQHERSGPVLLLNAVIRSIPPSADLWLTSLTQKSESIKITGSTLQADAIPDLMNNLTASGFFSSVELELIERNNDHLTFSLFCASANKSQSE
jgi:type IV pilus assembly protein PilN